VLSEGVGLSTFKLGGEQFRGTGLRSWLVGGLCVARGIASAAVPRPYYELEGQRQPHNHLHHSGFGALILPHNVNYLAISTAEG
jgi:hypothetical protein